MRSIFEATTGKGPPALESGGSIVDVAGIKVGHYTDPRRPTGCTVLLAEEGATAGVDVRGSAPGTRETDLLNPLNSVEKVHGIALAGGSVYGLESAAGVVRFLEEKGIGHPTSVAKIPIVPAAILFDLRLGNPAIRPDPQAGYEAARTATSESCAQGNVGAGAGATVGKLFGFSRAMKSGLGTSSMSLGTLVVGALVAVNAVGNVRNPWNGQALAGARTPGGEGIIDIMQAIGAEGWKGSRLFYENTTIGVVATNAILTKVQMNKVAQMSHNGLARAIQPVHTPLDGDTLFALSTGQDKQPQDLTLIGILAAETVAAAVCRAVLSARGLPGLPSHQDLRATGAR